MNAASLEDLAKDRPQSTSELLPSNDFYGNAHIIKRFVGLPLHYPLKVVIEHTIYIEDPINYFWEAEHSMGMPILLCANKEHADVYKQRTGQKAFPIGPIFKYAMTWKNGSPVVRYPKRKRVLIAPVHSAHHVDAYVDHNSLITAAREAHPGADMMALLYWKDINRGLHRHYVDQGIPVHSAGHIFDHNFLPRLLSIFSLSSHVVTNSIGTHVFVATILNRPTWFYEQEISYYGSSYCLTKYESYAEKLSRTQLDLIDLLKHPADKVSQETKDYVERLTGSKYSLPPDKMLEILSIAERIYQTKPHK